MPKDGMYKILMVTSNTEAVAALGSRLQERDYRLITAGNGAQGLLTAHAERPGLIIVDAELPVMSGYQMLQALRSDAHTEAITTILLLPHATDGEVAQGWMSGADFCLPRDGSMSDLVLMVDRAILAACPADYARAS